jgi:hypothetical protein
MNGIEIFKAEKTIWFPSQGSNCNKKLAEMITEITKAQLGLEIRSVAEEGKLQRTDLCQKE